MYTFNPNKSLIRSLINHQIDQLLKISPTNFMFLRIFNSEFSYVEVWLTDQNSKQLTTEYRVNLTLVINQYK